MAELYDRDIKTFVNISITYLRNKNSVVAKFATTAEDGKTEIIPLEKYLVTNRNSSVLSVFSVVY